MREKYNPPKSSSLSNLFSNRPAAKYASAPMPNATSAPKLDQVGQKLRANSDFFFEFKRSSLPFQVPEGLVSEYLTDLGIEYLRLLNGNVGSASSGYTGGYSIRVPDAFESIASGAQVSIRVVARSSSATKSRFAVAYSTNEVGNSGWRWFNAVPSWSLFSMQYDVPKMHEGRGDFVGLLPDVGNNPGTEFAFLGVSVAHP